MIAAQEQAGRRDHVNREVFRRYAGISLPRHVSYPMPTWWQAVGPEDAAAMHRDATGWGRTDGVSLYLHVPFCETLCKFCACNRIILRKDANGAADRVERYVAALQQDIRSLGALYGGGRRLRQIHWGGGSPTYLSLEQIERVHRTVLDCWDLSPAAEVAMEVDPRGVTRDDLAGLKAMGFNRLSMGVQDFDDAVQKHVRRVQSLEMVSDVVAASRDQGFASINFDLIYGMPYQTPDTIRDTVDHAIELSPDRVAYYHYAQIPEKIATQRGMDYTRLPDSETKLEMFLIGLQRFEAAGYEFIGLDHFARPDEGLSQSLRDGTLQRNFQGMTTGGGLTLLGAGVSSISHLPGVGFLQNGKEIDDYVTRIESGDSPVERGKRFSFDDRVRQAAINRLYCACRLEPEFIESSFDVRFEEYFQRELSVMRELQEDGLVSVGEDNVITVTRPLGRVLLRNVAAVFDAYLDPEAYRKGEQACFSANA